jgi:tetratricopeptide (TPR) repeat protein
MTQRLFVSISSAVLTWVAASVAGAQSLEANPWPPQGSRTALTGSGFKPNSPVALQFEAPVPTLEAAQPVPTRLQADASGEFRLDLQLAEPRLRVIAVSGALRAALRRDPPPLDYVADGTTVTTRSGDRVVQRFYLSGPVKTLERTPSGYRATVRWDSGVQENFTIENDKLIERVTFPPSDALLHTLLAPTFVKQAVPNAVNFWRERHDRDPTNPFLTLELGAALQRAGDPTAPTVLRSSLEVNAPFYVFVRLASRLERLKLSDLAQNALERAKRAFAAAGYDPGFPVTKVALSAWGDPLGQARRLFAAQNPVRGAAWLEYLRFTTPRFPGYGVVYTEFASFLESQGRGSEALDWRRLSAELDAGTMYGLGDQGYTRLETLGTLGVGLALGCYLLLQFVLMLKYYPQQTRDLHAHGGRFGATSRAPLVRLRFSLIAYQTITEKLFGVLLLAGAVGAFGVWNYARQAGDFLETPALGAGTAGGAGYFQVLNAVPAPGSAFLTGLGAQVDGDAIRALEAYRSIPDLPAAANNAGAILQSRGDAPGAQAEFTRASSLDPTMAAARLNLGNAAEGYRVSFHNALRKGLPMLETYSPQELVQFRFGSAEQEFVRFGTDPWNYLVALPLNVPDWVRGVVAVLIIAVLLWAVVWLIVPRVRSAARAPRSVLYHFGAIAVPGTGLADELWGILLLLPAVAVGVVLTREYLQPGLFETLFSRQPILGIGASAPFYDIGANLQWLWLALGAIYVVNFIGWLVETIAVSRRQRSTVSVQGVPPKNP